MIGILPNLPANVAGFHATGNVTKDDYEKVVFPEIERHKKSPGTLNFVFFVDTPMKNFSTGAWIRDLWLGLKGFARWHKVAIISNVESVRNFTDVISPLFPGIYKGFSPEKLEEAVLWASTEEQKPTTEKTVPEHFEQLLPAQTRGTSTTTSAKVSLTQEEDARAVFTRAVERLQDVNQWAETCGASTSFQLIDDSGEPLQGWANADDIIRIDLPGPGGREGEGYDWVKIEKLDNSSPDLFFMQVRPSRNPCVKDSTEIAHFLEASATSTFIVEKAGMDVTAAVYGRNEVPNAKDPESTVDKWRNAAIGSIGAMGLSKLQWKALTHGLLDKE